MLKILASMALLLLLSHFSSVRLCDPIDGSPPGSPVPGILQARTLEWVAISFSNAWKWKVKIKSLCCVWLLATAWTAAYQAPLSMGFSRQEYLSGVPFPSPIMALDSNIDYSISSLVLLWFKSMFTSFGQVMTPFLWASLWESILLLFHALY